MSGSPFSVSWLSLFAMALATSLALSTPAQACKCMFPPVETAREDASAVFEGRVLSIEDVPAGKEPGLGEKVITLAVVRTWKGLERDERIAVYTSAESAACGYSFAKDTSYLVYARNAEDQKLHVSSCSRTKPLADASEDLTVLGAGSTPVHIEQKAVEPAKTSPAPTPVSTPPAAPAQKKGCSVVAVGERGDSGPGATHPSVWLLATAALALGARRRQR